MSRRCDFCGRKPQGSVSRSHSKVATKRRLFLNLQTRHIDGEKKKLCTRCIKSLAKKSK